MEVSDQSPSELLVYQRSWFQALVSAPYLGAAYRVIQELQRFGRQKIKNGKKLMESDHFVQGLGELTLKYQAAKQLCAQTGHSITRFKRRDKFLLEGLFEASLVSKFFGTHHGIVRGLRVGVLDSEYQGADYKKYPQKGQNVLYDFHSTPIYGCIKVLIQLPYSKIIVGRCSLNHLAL